jgi:cytoskeletal protein CcmA (bactofilin family)
MPSLWPAVPTGATPAMKLLRRLFGLPEAGLASTPSAIGPGIHVKGEIHGEGTLTVHGVFEGDIVLDGTLKVGPEGRIDANVTAGTIVIAGAVRGNLSADTRVEILPTGSLTGTVKSASFAADAGATVKGEVWLEEGAGAPGAGS